MAVVDLRAAAELQQLLEGVALPARRNELVEYAAREHHSALQLAALCRLPDRSYASIDEVGEELVRVQPVRANEVPHEPREESGAPPGGRAYGDAA